VAKVIGRTAVASISGGAASVLAGGKFADGAYSAAFFHLFNSEAHRVAQEARLCSVPLIDWAGDKLTELIHHQSQIHPAQRLCEGAAQVSASDCELPGPDSRLPHRPRTAAATLDCGSFCCLPPAALLR
jgi:hypothetical protein